ncbi:MAG: hypothetical protein IVW57_10725 [Ktedonobacterales bacterium]|nr:hypothetical protein [Ktedonobacterales bacterium]
MTLACSLLAVEREEFRQLGSRLHRRDPFVVDDDLLEEQPGEAIALFQPRRRPGDRHIRQESSQASETGSASS